MSVLSDFAARFRPPVLWRPGEPITAEKLNRMVAGVIRSLTVGPGLRKVESPDGSQVAIGLDPRSLPVYPVVWRASVVDATGCGPGRYNGLRVLPVTVPIPVATTSAGMPAPLGPTGESVLIVNSREYYCAGGGHGLYPGTQVTGVLIGASDDGRPAIQVDEVFGDVFLVILERTSGSAGSGASPPSWVYDVKRSNGDGTVLATGKSPLLGRTVGQFAEADKGLAIYDPAGSGGLVLLYAFEVAGTGGCG